MIVDKLYERLDFFEIGTYGDQAILSVVVDESLALQFWEVVVLIVEKDFQVLILKLQLIGVDGMSSRGFRLNNATNNFR